MVLAKLNVGQKEYKVKIRDVKFDLMHTLRLHKQSVADMPWHKNYLFANYFSQDIAYLEAIDKGLTNNANFITAYRFLADQKYSLDLFAAGDNYLAELFKKSQAEAARASQIFLKVEKTKIVGGKLYDLTPAEYSKLASDKEALALDTINSLKGSKNLFKEFGGKAALLSDDADTTQIGGNLGYFTRGMVQKELETAAFDAKKPGLISQVIKTHDGIYILCDESLNNCWISGDGDSQWISVDLGSKYSISKVSLSWGEDYAKVFKIQTSLDEKIWNNGYSTSEGVGNCYDINLDKADARYVRMIATAGATNHRYSLWKFEVYP